ncbi:hypothetical protein B9G69_014060 [Bdellovibrio sp. SKB1291214]|uniref:hypothetical protein n=1 Tax=Bdellovibrio sp. SKB1291214 TaxID=1732569 RepID=UPI000B51661F|nr:hypothetical protein [Bdellovibrio sp. SKB1291214]UYL08172.1 hypothetical protein B9G69_014060 [Bdellovibrio sp. SKB1291214]
MADLRKWFKNTLIALVAIVSLTGSLTAHAQSTLQCQSVFTLAETKSLLFFKESIDEKLLDDVIIETIEGHGNITSRFTVNQTEALALGEKWMGQEYSQIGKAGSGVFLSSDGKRRFRIDNNSVLGNHSPYKPHVHLELVNPQTQVVISNNHIILN